MHRILAISAHWRRWIERRKLPEDNCKQVSHREYIAFDLPHGVDGKRNRKHESCPGMTEAKARKHLRAIETDIARGLRVAPSKKTLAEYLEKWLANCESRGLTVGTIHNYRGSCNRYIVPKLGRSKLEDLKPTQIQELLDDLAKHLSSKTASCVYGILHKALGQAVRWQMIARNPMDFIEPPKVRRNIMSTVKDCEIPRLLEVIEKSDHGIAVLIALCTGIRRGEVVGLKWEDFNFHKRTLFIGRSICQVSGRDPFAKGLKNDKMRTIPVPEYLACALQEHHRKQLRARTEGKYLYPDEGWICTMPDGKHITPGALTKAFLHIREKAGTNVRFHDLRHTVVTYLLTHGASMKQVTAYVGHDTLAMTDRYGHVVPQSEMADLLDVMVRPQLSAANDG